MIRDLVSAENRGIFCIILAARRPFNIKFRSNMYEVDVASSAAVNNDETNSTPKGYIGFSLDFFQESC